MDLAKARELAHHYRWRAAKIAPREYGDRVQVDQTVTSLAVTIDAGSLDPGQRDALRAALRGAVPAGAPMIEGAVEAADDPSE